MSAGRHLEVGRFTPSSQRADFILYKNIQKKNIQLRDISKEMGITTNETFTQTIKKNTAFVSNQPFCGRTFEFCADD